VLCYCGSATAVEQLDEDALASLVPWRVGACSGFEGRQIASTSTGLWATF
jgi:hypothetical protein